MNPPTREQQQQQQQPHNNNQQPCINQGLKTPTHKTYDWSNGWSNRDSPGSGEVPQDIVWDSTSPNPGNGPRDNRVIEISDIVNRIAPKNGKPVGPVSPWRQWISDGTMTCTPENPQTRVRRKSIRKSNAEDLVNLARQFDHDLREHGETPLRTPSETPLRTPSETPLRTPSETPLRTPSTRTAPQSSDAAGVQESFGAMWEGIVPALVPGPLEAELHALFDSSTQRISGGLSSQGSASSVSARSQEKKIEGCPGGQATSSAANGVPPQQAQLTSAGSSSQQYKSPHAVGANPAKGERSSDAGVAKCDNLDDDDWDNDDLLLELAMMSQHPEPPRSTEPRPTSSVRPSTSQQPSDCKPHTSGSAARQAPRPPPQPSGGRPQEPPPCPKPKTSTRRSTFKLESNPHFRPSSGLASDLDQEDTTWDNLDDDMLFEVCENAEKISGSTQPELARSTDCLGKRGGNAKDCQQNATTPLAIKTRSINSANSDVKRQLSRTFVRSNSLPVAANYQGWNTPFNGAKAPQSVMSQSHPGTLEGLGTFSHLKDSSVAVQPHTVTARPTQNSSHSSFKRTLSDSGVAGNKVLVTNQTAAKCSAAEIERKKREALARRRQRMSQMSQKR